jgi:hypothetical protein
MGLHATYESAAANGESRVYMFQVRQNRDREVGLLHTIYGAVAPAGARTLE